MKREKFNTYDALLLIGDGFADKINLNVREMHFLDEEKSELPHSKLSTGVSRIISEKNELHVKYDRLLKDYELARHECKQKDVYIKELEREQEKLLRELNSLRGEKEYVLKLCKDSESKLLAIKEIVSGN